MTRQLAVMVALMSTLVGAGRVSAQEAAPRPRAGSVVVALIPGGATFFTQSESGKEPGFTSYAPAGDVEIYLNHYLSVEGELGGGIGAHGLVTYSGNVVVMAPSDGALAPYLTIGAGGLTLLQPSTIEIARNRTFLTGNAGAGIKWFNATSRWGVRVDYRFIAVRADDRAPNGFGQETRFANRAYAALLVNISH